MRHRFLIKVFDSSSDFRIGGKTLTVCHRHQKATDEDGSEIRFSSVQVPFHRLKEKEEVLIRNTGSKTVGMPDEEGDEIGTRQEEILQKFCGTGIKQSLLIHEMIIEGFTADI